MTYIYNYPINYPVNFHIRSAVYRPVSQAVSTSVLCVGDSFTTNPLYKNSELAIEKLEQEAKNNTRIREIMRKYNLPVKINKQTLEELQKGHLADTRVVAAKIYSCLPEQLKAQVNLPNLQEAAMLHDYGKILIPNKILNKPSDLTQSEREIIEQHSELGYELLKNKSLNPESLNLIKYHHQTPQNNGYPINSNNFEYGLSSQILKAADKYSALREARSYKDAKNKQETLNIIANDVANGEIFSEIYSALQKGVN